MANKDAAQATLQALASTTQASDAVTVSGEVDTIRYGTRVAFGRTGGVRGVGQTYDGLYYVQRVTHQIQRGKYTQSFSLTREGRERWLRS